MLSEITRPARGGKLLADATSLSLQLSAAYWAAQMSKLRPPFRLLAVLALLFAQVVVCERNLFSADLLPPGFRPLPLGVHALVGGKIVPKPGETIEGGTIVIRDGIIRAVGKDVTV